MESNELAANHAWQIGAAIEAGVDTQEARRRIDAGEIVVPAAGMVIGGGFGLQLLVLSELLLKLF